MQAPIRRMLTNTLTRNMNVLRNQVRNSGHDHGGDPSKSVPFDISNRYKLTAYFLLFFGSGLALPFLITRHQLLKNK